MQLRLELLANGMRLPIAYRQYVQAAIYHALREHPAYAQQLHDCGAQNGGKTYKLFTFSQLEGAYRVSGNVICFPGNVCLEIRSIHDALVLYLFSYFSGNREIRIADQRLVITGCWMSDKRLEDPSMKVFARSPVVAYRTCEDKKTIFYKPEDPEFCALLCANAERKWRSLYGGGEPISLQIELVPNCRYTKQVTEFKGTCVTAWFGHFHLSGDSKMLNFLYQTGLGAKNSQGFGMFDLLMDSFTSTVPEQGPICATVNSNMAPSL